MSSWWKSGFRETLLLVINLFQKNVPLTFQGTITKHSVIAPYRLFDYSSKNWSSSKSGFGLRSVGSIFIVTARHIMVMPAIISMTPVKEIMKWLFFFRMKIEKPNRVQAIPKMKSKIFFSIITVCFSYSIMIYIYQLFCNFSIMKLNITFHFF